jgi:transcriptional regulator with XRE-family HTH domain
LDLRTLRENAGLSQPQLAVAAGVSVRSVWKAETGKEITRLIAAKICKVFGVEPEQVEGLKFK